MHFVCLKGAQRHLESVISTKRDFFVIRRGIFLFKGRSKTQKPISVRTARAKGALYACKAGRVCRVAPPCEATHDGDAEGKYVAKVGETASKFV